LINAWIIHSCDNAWIINSFYLGYRSPIRSDYETTLSIRSEMNILVPKSERIRSDRIRIGFAHIYWHKSQRCKLVFNAVFNAMRTLPDLTRIINTAITVKLLTSKVTSLNTCEKLKMTHEKQLDLGNIKSKVNETCYCETCHN
jgi:hypothetical protein